MSCILEFNNFRGRINGNNLCCRSNQGAQLWCVLSEALLDYEDFIQWKRDNDKAGSVLYPSSREEFEVWSGQAWTHLLMQVIKVSV